LKKFNKSEFETRIYKLKQKETKKLKILTVLVFRFKISFRLFKKYSLVNFLVDF